MFAYHSLGNGSILFLAVEEYDQSSILGHLIYRNVGDELVIFLVI